MASGPLSRDIWDLAVEVLGAEFLAPSTQLWFVENLPATSRLRFMLYKQGSLQSVGIRSESLDDFIALLGFEYASLNACIPHVLDPPVDASRHPAQSDGQADELNEHDHQNLLHPFLSGALPPRNTGHRSVLLQASH
jgi:hypothetical protein